MIPCRFFRRTDFRLLKEGSTDKLSSVLDLYSPSDNKKQKSQKAHRNYFIKLLANTIKCSFLLLKCFYLKSDSHV